MAFAASASGAWRGWCAPTYLVFGAFVRRLEKESARICDVEDGRWLDAPIGIRAELQVVVAPRGEIAKGRVLAGQMRAAAENVIGVASNILPTSFAAAKTTSPLIRACSTVILAPA